MARPSRKVIHVSAIGLTASALLKPQGLDQLRSGFKVGFVFSPEPAMCNELQNEGFFVHEQYISRRIEISDLLSILRLAAYFRAERPDIVHTHTSKGGAVGRIAAWLARVPLIIHTIHGFPFVEGQSWLKYHLYLWIEKWLAPFTDYFLSQSREDVKTAILYGIKARCGYPIHISNGVDISRFSPDTFDSETRLRIRESLGIGEEPVITVVARLVFEKGYMEMVEALSQVQDLVWTALFAGPDEEAGEEIMNRIRAFGFEERVKLLGFRKDIDALLAVTDVFVLPSYREGVPRTLIEAQAMGVPCIATDIRGCREVIRDGESGYLVKPREAAGLSVALRQLLENRELRREMGKKARTIAEQEFDEKLVFERIARVYDVGLDSACRTS